MATAVQKTASTHRTAVFRGAHQLDILGYTTRRRLGGADNNTVRSCSFDAGGFLWTLVCRFHPNLFKGVTLASVSLELSCNETDEAAVATASVRIDDPSGTGRWPAAEWHSEEPNVFPARSSTPVSWELAVPDAFRDHEARYVDADADCLTVHCTVDVHREESTMGATTRSCLVSVPPRPSLGKEIHRLREEMWWPDVTFLVDEAKIQEHRLVLAMRSPVFAAEFNGGMKEKTMRCIRVVDMSARTFKAMLYFIYTDELPKPKNKACPVAMARDLLVAADLYDLERLRLMCENILSESITTDNVMATLMLVHNRQRCHRLEASCVEYMASDPDVYEAVEATEEYKELDKTCQSFINDITKKVAKRAVDRNRSPSSSSSSGNSNREATSASRYNPSAVMIGTHEFRIENLSVVRKIHCDVGQCVQSKFQVGGYEWTLTVYPSGEREEYKEYIGLFLKPTINDDTNVKALVTLKLVNPIGKPSRLCKFTHIYSGRKCNKYGWPGILTVASANSHYVGHDGSFTIQCRLEVTTEACTSNTVVAAAASVSVPPSNMSWHLEQLLASEEGWDVKFLVEECEIHAHGLMIATRSPALHELVESATSTDHVRVDGMKASTFKAMLHFIYTDEIPRIEDLVAPSGSGDYSTTVAREMLAAARRFRLERMRLRLMCENILCESITTDNVMATLMLVHNRQRCHRLEASCVEYMASDPDVYEAVEATEEYKELDKTCQSFINDITKKVAKRAVDRNRSPSSSSSETTSLYNPSAVMIGTHEFRIENLSVVRKIHCDVGQCVQSKFQVGGYEWTLTVYPSGEREEYKEYIGFFLKPTIKDDTNVKASVTLKLVDPIGKPSRLCKFTHIYSGRKCNKYGWPGILTVASANSHYVGHDGSFTIQCRLEVTTEACTSNTVVAAAASVSVPPSNMSWHLEQLLASEEGWDVKFLVEECEIHAHGFMIATRSPALHELVESATSTDHVWVDGMKASTFKAMLHFIYTDEIPRIEDLVAPSGSGDYSTTVAREMLAAARRFRLDRMRRLCENLLAENITPGNALATLELAGRHGCTELETYCIDYIALPDVVKDVMKTLSSFCRISK